MTINVNKHEKAFNKRGLSLPEWYVLSIPGQWTLPESDVPDIAASQSEGDPRGEVTPHECEIALEKLISRGLLRVIDTAARNNVKAKLVLTGYGTPVYGLPKVGDIDFTANGAVTFRSLSNELYGKYWFSEALVNGKKRIVFTYLKKRLRLITAEAANRQMSCSIRRIGKWSIYWWLTFPSGWMITLSRKRSGSKRQR
jgi:hypothetical protein